MTAEAQPASASTGDEIEIPACDNPAVAFCCDAWMNAYEKAIAEGESHVVARVAGHEAYREAMPPLSGERNIRDYIACVVHGMAINAILIDMGSRLLYGAQIAHRARRVTSKNGKSEKTSQKPDSAVK